MAAYDQSMNSIFSRPGLKAGNLLAYKFEHAETAGFYTRLEIYGVLFSCFPLPTTQKKSRRGQPTPGSWVVITT